MNYSFTKIILHKQINSDSCVPMSVELVCKLLGLMKISDTHLQNDRTKYLQSNWILPTFKYPYVQPKIEFSREFKLGDHGLQDRGLHFMKDYFEDLFKTIDNELALNRFVIISLRDLIDPNKYHMYVIFNKIDKNNYQTLTFWFNNHKYDKKNINLRQRVAKMLGTDILTYKFI